MKRVQVQETAGLLIAVIFAFATAHDKLGGGAFLAQQTAPGKSDAAPVVEEPVKAKQEARPAPLRPKVDALQKAIKAWNPNQEIVLVSRHRDTLRVGLRSGIGLVYQNYRIRGGAVVNSIEAQMDPSLSLALRNLYRALGALPEGAVVQVARPPGGSDWESLGPLPFPHGRSCELASCDTNRSLR